MNESGAISTPRPAAPPPPCAAHADRPARWYCPACRLALCDDCLRIAVTPRGSHFAPCPRCHNACDEILDDRRRAELKAEAAKAARQRRRLNLQLYHGPAGLLAIALLIHAGYELAAQGPLGLVVPVGWLIAHVIIVTAAWAGVHRWLSLDFDPTGSTVLRLAALATAVHAVRTLSWHAAAVDLPDSILAGVAMLAPLSICYVLLPVAIGAVGLKLLFDLDVFEHVAGTVTLFLAINIAYIAVILTGLPT